MSDVSDDLYLTDKQYVALLHRQRDRIEAGVSLNSEDSTSCSWGLCTTEMEVWPEDTWLFEPFPATSTLQKEARSKYLKDAHFCAFDRKDNRQASEFGSAGCFYRCRIFKPKGEQVPDRQQALDLYQIRIKQSAQLGSK